MTPAEPFSVVLTQAVAQRDLTLERLSARLRALGTPVSIATLSYWQSGRSIPTRAKSLAAVEHLEKILQLAPGHLMSALSPDEAGRWDPLAVLPPQEQVFAVLDQMGMDLDRHVTTLVMQDGIRISPGGHIHRQSTRQLVRAERDGVVHTPLVLFNGETESPPGVTAHIGCSIGQLAVLEDISAVVAEIVFPRPLQRGDLALFEYHSLREVRNTVQDKFHRLLASQAQSLVLHATFEGTAAAGAEYGFRERDDIPEEQGRYTPVTAGHHIQAVITDPPAGTHTLRWQPPAEHLGTQAEERDDARADDPDADFADYDRYRDPAADPEGGR